jgi:threonine dehydrogenase-like Zn-dependent dehydrogenase
MRGAVLHAPGDVRLEERDDPRIVEPTDAIIRLSATCVCGSDLWPYRGIEVLQRPAPMGHEYAGIVEQVGRESERSNSSMRRRTARPASTGPKIAPTIKRM